MSIFKKLFSPPRNIGTFYAFSVKCKRCGETLHGRVNVINEPSFELDDNGNSFYFCRKVLIGEGPCFQPVEVVFKFDEDRKVLEQKITGGEFIED